ncbi:hypothetical protein BDW62DRAFT_204235 [Aspergillus aurantiobrunneus]
MASGSDSSRSFQEARALLKGSRNVKGEMPIEDYLSYLDPYRSTTLNLPYSLPTIPASPETVQKVGAHREEILRILESHHFPPPAYLRMSIQSLKHPLHTILGPLRTNLSLAYITDPHSPIAPRAPASLAPARRDISDLLNTHSIKDVYIEIVFVNQSFDPTLFAVSDDHPTTEAFDAVSRELGRVVAPLGNRCPLLDLFSAGLTVETALPTVVVQVSPFTTADWDAMASEMLALLPDSMGFVVEFIPGMVIREIAY